MTWNIDFAIAAGIVETIILIFYIRGRFLPTSRNRIFLVFLVLEWINICLDIISSVVHNYHQLYGTSFLYAITICYFISLFLTVEFFFFYAINIGRVPRRFRRFWSLSAFAVSFAFSILVITTPWNHLLFYVSSVEGYHKGSLYNIIFATMAGIMILIGIMTSVGKKWVSQQHRRSIYFALGCILLGAVLQTYIYTNTLLTNAGVVLAIFVLYINMQNPMLYRDKKTGVFSNESFIEIGGEEHRGEFPLYAITIGDMSVVRRLHGEALANETLNEVARWLIKTFPGELIYYIHGGSFVMTGRHFQNKYQMRDAIEERFEQDWVVGYRKEHIQLYENIVIVPNELSKMAPVDMLAGLDKSIYIATQRGKGTFQEMDQEMIDSLRYERKVSHALDRTIKKNSIQIFFQPIISAKDEKIVGAEVLARLQDDELGFVPPDMFIAMAERSGQIVELGKQIFEKSCQFMRKHQMELDNLMELEINLSPVQCTNDEMTEEFVEIMEKYHIDMHRINLEITETATTDKRNLSQHMKLLEEFGVTFSLDDYGTGFSNMIQILELPFRTVKIDKSIVWAYFDGGINILGSVIDMFHAQNLKLVAEGVETREMVDELTRMGCDYLQGFYYARPLPEQEFLKFLKEQKQKEQER